MTSSSSAKLIIVESQLQPRFQQMAEELQILLEKQDVLLVAGLLMCVVAQNAGFPKTTSPRHSKAQLPSERIDKILELYFEEENLLTCRREPDFSFVVKNRERDFN